MSTRGRTLLVGANGLLGRDLRAALRDRDTTAVARSDLDVTDEAAVVAAAAGHDTIVNAAAYTRVDEAESDEPAAYAVNALGARNLAVAAARHGARLVQVSTDYVFDGRSTAPYPEDAPRHPISAYGRTKAAGEEFVEQIAPDRSYIVRTAWLYGAHGPNFARTMLALAASKDTWAVVDDQHGQPTWARDLADAIVALLDADAPAGIYHGTSSGETTWFGFARAVLAASGLDPDRITPTGSADFPRPAPRPAYSVLGHAAWTSAGLAPIRDWEEALSAAVVAGALAAAGAQAT
ncbi:dTDP-4-dehydrorhamnose reductase [Agromyces sp. Marseille-P2726]|uniref:dTDP-4-dehydrorhamnose reductase n=1 Tax=Agromyces sp. Marseille-P2726 TaxID=2709132 RepID=UPI00156EA8B7|nr:dTDP-4-dehydrorhamnose reductase [Agromyces sp. Marseille-P2726]